MQLRYALTTLLLALACAENVVGRHTLLRRQDSADDTSVAPASTTESITSSKESPTTSSVTSKATKSQTQTKEDSPTTTEAKPKEDATHTTAAKHPTSSAAHNETASANDVELPIQPTITPAMGVAGVLLLLTGAAYTIIGIKHQWLLVFLSAAYLASLSIAVLIEYVMSPPVSDAIQGAYMVAAVVTGLVFGAICLVFKEVTEGLACLLGGFCISMWFLVLKPGGLIASTTGRAIMIGVFSAVAWSLSFSQYTRNYGLIVCTAFAGATITILGIDCFSRAGLKEFWLYIWDLNDNTFPIHTTTYPITRGIRVEIAGTIVLFLFGVMSQIKVWKIVKERKSKKEAARAEEERRRDLRDSVIGKRVEANNERSLAQWEAVYGDREFRRTPADSGVGTSLDDDFHKKSTSVVERELESIELDDVNDQNNARASKRPESSVMALGNTTEEPSRGPELQLDLEGNHYSWWSDFRSTKSKSHTGTRRSVDQPSVIEFSDHLPVPPVPGIMSLPFSPNAKNNEQRKSSEGSAASKTPAENDAQDRPVVALNKSALKQLNERAPAALPRIDDDRASSVAATANEDPDMDNLSTRRLSMAPSNYQLEVDKAERSPFADEFEARDQGPSGSRTPGTPGEEQDLEDDEEALLRPATGKRDSQQHTENRKDHKQQGRKSSIGSNQRQAGSDDEGDDSTSDDVASVHSLKADNLPESISKVAMAYRTNEWAKHIAEADQPDLDQVPEEEADEPSVQIEINRPQEAAKPVDTDALLETGGANGKRPKTSNNNPSRHSKDRSTPRRRSVEATPVYAFSRASSYQSLQGQGSSTSIQQQRRETRNSSAPISQQPLVESPTEESPYQDFDTPIGSTANLLDDRNNRLKKRITTTSFNALTTVPNVNTIVPSSIDGAAAAENTSSGESKEDLTLAERKALIDQGAIQPSSSRPKSRHRPPSATGPNPTLGRMNSTTNPHLIYDSHQPQRRSSNTADKKQQQNAMLTQWRQSLQQEGIARPTINEEQARNAMLSQRRQASFRSQREQMDRETRENMRDVAMRTGQLTNAHQDAMRRMQAKANKATME